MIIFVLCMQDENVFLKSARCFTIENDGAEGELTGRPDSMNAESGNLFNIQPDPTGGVYISGASIHPRVRKR